MILKLLGAIDLSAAIIFLMMVFGMDIFISVLLFCALLLLIKSLFIFSGDVLSFIDLFAALTLILSIIFPIFIFLSWIFALLLFAKSFVSFL